MTAKGAQKTPGSAKKKPVSNAAGRKKPGTGGRPPYDDSGIIAGVGMLIAENRWLREHGQQVPVLDITNAIKQAVERTYEVWWSESKHKGDAINQAVERIETKLKKTLPNGKSTLDDAVERAAQQKTIWGTPIRQTLLSTPLPPAVNADTVLLHEFIAAVNDLVEWSGDVSRSTYTILDNDTRADIKRLLACFKKIMK